MRPCFFNPTVCRLKTRIENQGIDDEVIAVSENSGNVPSVAGSSARSSSCCLAEREVHPIGTELRVEAPLERHDSVISKSRGAAPDDHVTVHHWNPHCLATARRTTEKKVGSSRVDLQACKLEYSIVSPK